MFSAEITGYFFVSVNPEWVEMFINEDRSSWHLLLLPVDGSISPVISFSMELIIVISLIPCVPDLFAVDIEAV